MGSVAGRKVGQVYGRTVEWCTVQAILQWLNFIHTEQKSLGVFEVRSWIRSLKFLALALDAISAPPSLTQDALDLFINSWDQMVPLCYKCQVLCSGCRQGARWVWRDPVVWELFGPAEAPGNSSITSDNMASTKEGFRLNALLGLFYVVFHNLLWSFKSWHSASQT